eukprot:scaffold256683_cov19-Tisochrysis_lutea.AAC.1
MLSVFQGTAGLPGMLHSRQGRELCRERGIQVTLLEQKLLPFLSPADHPAQTCACALHAPKHPEQMKKPIARVWAN